jgi:diguanylate cyclase (GGDEF)-like protein
MKRPIQKQVNAIRALEREVARLKKLAFTDELTGLYNRHGFREISSKLINEVIQSRKRLQKRRTFVIKDFSIIVFDLDHFKKVNDTYGHDAGDKVLKAFGVIALDRVRDLDIVARWGGEEIVVGLVGASERDALKVAEGIRAGFMEKRFRLRRKNVQFTVSGGVASLTRAKDFPDLFKKADRALYAAKNAGRNTVKLG